jgi:hypothetical protein
MSGNNSHPDSKSEPPQQARKRSTWPLIIVAVLFIVVPFLAWYGTWFGRDLSDEKITEYLSDEQKPRHVQHALAQIAMRLEKKDGSARRWYPQIVALSKSNVAELRSNVAWLMGKDNLAEEFHAALLNLLQDTEPLVQRNAALSLVTFNDSKSLPVLRSMLQPFALTAPVAGTVSSILKESTPIRHGMMLSRLKANENQFVEVRSPLPGELSKVVAAEGAQVKAGDTMLFIAPDSEAVWEALRALYIMGQPEDLQAVERYAQGVEGMPEKIKEQAALTAKAIQSRSAKSQ